MADDEEGLARLRLQLAELEGEQASDITNMLAMIAYEQDLDGLLDAAERLSTQLRERELELEACRELNLQLRSALEEFAEEEEEAYEDDISPATEVWSPTDPTDIEKAPVAPLRRPSRRASALAHEGLHFRVDSFLGRIHETGSSRPPTPPALPVASPTSPMRMSRRLTFEEPTKK